MTNQIDTKKQILVVPPMPAHLETSQSVDLRTVMGLAFAAHYNASSSFRESLQGIDKASYLTGSRDADNAFAAQNLLDFCRSEGGVYAPLTEITFREFNELFKKARAKNGVSVSERLKLAKASSAAA